MIIPTNDFETLCKIFNDIVNNPRPEGRYFALQCLQRLIDREQYLHVLQWNVEAAFDKTSITK